MLSLFLLLVTSAHASEREATSIYGNELKCESFITEKEREAYLRKAIAFRPVTADEIRSCEMINVKLDQKGKEGFVFNEEVSCEYEPKGDSPLRGGSSKFKCRVGGNKYKVKYQLQRNYDGNEVFTEVAATRLMNCLGGYADYMFPVRVIARNSPPDPWKSEAGILPQVRFEMAAIEVKRKGELLETSADSGWDWAHDLPLVQDRAQADALALFGALIQHADSKPDNQRFMCEKADTVCGQRKEPVCSRPVIMIQDFGHAFGKSAHNRRQSTKMDLDGWRSRPVWKDKAQCIASVQPYQIQRLLQKKRILGTLEDPRISEAGRRLLADRLDALTPQQRVDLFRAARVELRDPARTAEQWAQALTEKIEEIKSAHCPQ
jgi:hypothetical protein